MWLNFRVAEDVVISTKSHLAEFDLDILSHTQLASFTYSTSGEIDQMLQNGQDFSVLMNGRTVKHELLF